MTRRGVVRALLAAAGQSTTPVDQWSPPEPRRIGRPAVGAKVEVRIPDDLLAAVDAIAAADGTSRAAVIRAAVADLVELRETGLDAWVAGALVAARSDARRDGSARRGRERTRGVDQTGRVAHAREPHALLD